MSSPNNINTQIKEDFAIHKQIDSSHNEFCLNYKNYLHKKPINDYVEFFSTGKKNQIKEISNKSNKYTSNDWVTIIIVAIFTVIVFTRHYFFKRFSLLIKAFGSVRLFNQFVREGNVFKERISFPLFLASILTTSLFVYEIIDYYKLGNSFDLKDTMLFLAVTACVFLIYAIKLFIKIFIGLLFKTKVETLEHLSSNYIFDIVTTLLILPIIIIQTYHTAEILFITGGIFISLIFIFRLIRLIGIGLNKSKFSGYYLFLYLCSVEILPVIVFAKMAIIYFHINI